MLQETVSYREMRGHLDRATDIPSTSPSHNDMLVVIVAAVKHSTTMISGMLGELTVRIISVSDTT